MTGRPDPQDEDLDDLRWHYGEAYLIQVIGGRWVAQRRDSHASISADTAAGLLDLIRADYARKPVCRWAAGEHPPAGRGRFTAEG